MPSIRSSTDLRNNYNAISAFCHESREPVFITKNGQGDLAVMSIDVYEILKGKLELFHLLERNQASSTPPTTEDKKAAMQRVRNLMAGIDGDDVDLKQH